MINYQPNVVFTSISNINIKITNYSKLRVTHLNFKLKSNLSWIFLMVA